MEAKNLYIKYLLLFLLFGLIIISFAYYSNIFKDTNLKLFGIIIPLIAVLGLSIAVYSTKIREDLIKAVEESKEKEEIINQFIPISIADENGIITDVNDAFCELTSFRKDELIGFSHNKLKSGAIDNEVYNDLWYTIRSGNIWIGELENIKKNGQTYWIEIIIKPKFDEKNKKVGFTSISHNITDKKLTEKLAKTDHLTNLANRNRLDEELEKAIYSVKRYNTNISLMMLDIDYFKKVNDKFGHNAGDSVLIEFANVLKQNIRKSDIVGRWGGEEFIIIAYETNSSEMRKLAEKIRIAIEKYEFRYVGNKTCSIGYTQITNIDKSAKRAVNRADKYLYNAKASGRNIVYGDEKRSIIVENDFSI